MSKRDEVFLYAYVGEIAIGARRKFAYKKRRANVVCGRLGS